MGKYSSAGDAAADETNAALAASLSKMEPDPKKVADLFPPGQRFGVSDLIEKVQASTSENDRKTAIREFGEKFGEVAVNGLKQLVKAALVVLLVCGPAVAQEMSRRFGETGAFAFGTVVANASTQAEPSLILAIGDLLKRTRAGYIATLRGGVVRHAGPVYAPFRWFHRSGRPDQPFVEIGIGFETENGRAVRPLIPIACNFGELMRRAFSSKWARSHTTGADLSPFFIGPVVRLPLVDLKRYVLGHEVGILAAVKIGG